MSVIERSILEVEPGFRSKDAALFMAALDDQHALLISDLEGITPAELEWQLKPGMNTIGMLLAHIAIVEVFWTQVGPERRKREEYETDSILGIDLDTGDGMPAAAGALPPAHLSGKTLEYYKGLLATARGYANRVCMTIEDSALSPIFQRTRRNGTVEEVSLRWVLYHMLEHFSGHYGQILLLRHMYRDAAR
ncbi:MAG TPA: DUF664 domain-containing protein [Candidatus Eisenbacteria bacterium]|nr:DUF664 domain-containing protein [Candidatus Eisenbacteria bacterium]